MPAGQRPVWARAASALVGRRQTPQPSPRWLNGATQPGDVMAETPRTVRRRVVWWALLALLAAPFPACDATRPSANVPIMSDFGTKIVYGTSRRLDVAALRQHCADLRGMFNECGTICAPGADMCVAVCAYTCERIPR